MITVEERTRCYIDTDSKVYTKGLVAIYQLDDRVCFEYGYFKPDKDTVLFYDTVSGNVIKCISKNISDKMMFSTQIGYYILTPTRKIERLRHALTKGYGNYPYNIKKEYEAEKSFDIFKGAQNVIYDQDYELSKYLNYTFGIEFETSEGYVPQDICFRDGLIPLRDGSITGVEYSTVVMSGNSGLNLLKQQCETLKKYTDFNKNCALHIHFGGYPINEKAIFALYKILYNLQGDIEKLIPPYSFHSGNYKDNGKEYCAELPFFETFEQFYNYMSDGRCNYMGDLYQAHPDDVEHERKWNIASRYHNFNFINMLFYDKAKTLELRFLRPSFNFNKIMLWIAIFNAILIYAERSASKLTLKQIESQRDKTSKISLVRIIGCVYSDEFLSWVYDGMMKLKCVVENQVANGDRIGECVRFEDELF